MIFKPTAQEMNSQVMKTCVNDKLKMTQKEAVVAY
jgi:hypothetical protein